MKFTTAVIFGQGPGAEAEVATILNAARSITFLGKHPVLVGEMKARHGVQGIYTAIALVRDLVSPGRPILSNHLATAIAVLEMERKAAALHDGDKARAAIQAVNEALAVLLPAWRSQNSAVDSMARARRTA